MADMTSTENSAKALGKIPFTMYDAGWVVLCIGMAIGAGTVVMPIQIGLKAGIRQTCCHLPCYPRSPRGLYHPGDNHPVLLILLYVLYQS